MADLFSSLVLIVKAQFVFTPKPPLLFDFIFSQVKKEILREKKVSHFANCVLILTTRSAAAHLVNKPQVWCLQIMSVCVERVKSVCVRVCVRALIQAQLWLMFPLPCTTDTSCVASYHLIRTHSNIHKCVKHRISTSWECGINHFSLYIILPFSVLRPSSTLFSVKRKRKTHQRKRPDAWNGSAQNKHVVKKFF